VILTEPIPLYSRRDAAAEGLKPMAGAVPVELREWKHGRYPLFTKDQLEPKKVIVRKPPVESDLLASIFSVNRTAKRFRDKATAHFSQAQYGFATDAREVKERLYALKDRGIVHAFRQGLLTAVGSHGPLTYFEGGGYRFHSLLRPAGQEIPVLSTETIQVEAKPKARREVRLKDAEHTLGLLPALDTNGFVRQSFPPRRKSRPYWDERADSDWDDEQGVPF
jgi:hypothetical protein